MGWKDAIMEKWIEQAREGNVHAIKRIQTIAFDHCFWIDDQRVKEWLKDLAKKLRVCQKCWGKGYVEFKTRVGGGLEIPCKIKCDACDGTGKRGARSA